VPTRYERLPAGEVLLSLRSIRKAFGATVAVRDASFEVRAGEVHALMGENGSGKSTLVKILSGVHAPDRGTISVRGTSHAAFRSPKEALAAGVATVFQEVLATPNRSVLDNLWLGADGVFRISRSQRERRRLAEEVLAELLESPPSLDTLVGDLDLSDRQACAIARAVLRQPSLLVLDEATSALDFDTRNRLFAMIRRQVAAGAGVILITHRMDEVREIADRVTVLRTGETVDTLSGEDWTTAELVRLMTGQASLVGDAPQQELARREPGQVVLRTRQLRLGAGRAPIDFALRAGEIVGLAGLEGQGQDAFLRSLWGLGGASGTVERVEGERAIPVPSKYAARRAGIAYVPRERRAESIFEWMSILDNFTPPTLTRDRRGGLLSSRAALTRFSDYIGRLRIKLGRPADGIGTLSGGNQQKVIIARWLAADPAILLLNDPTRGIDIGAKRDLYALLGELAERGLAVVMLSTEVDEHLELMDRVLVFRDEEVSAEFSHAELSRETLVASFFGAEEVAR